MMLRIDRAAVWRSVPLRRGLMVLALMPGAVALAGDLEWRMLTILPGLVASGGALLFGVNTWCLDGRGALWRDSLPVSPRLAFVVPRRRAGRGPALLGAGDLVLAALRAGRPTWPEVVALVCSTLWSSPPRWSRPACAGASRARSRSTCAAPGPRLLRPW